MRRLFSTSHRRLASHYETLGIPPDATRNQIKSNFYRLSKQYHPDVAQDTSAKGKFQAISEAYAVLADDRQRRAYDRALTEASKPTRSQYGATYESRRNRGATYAWEARRPGFYHQGQPHRPQPPPKGNPHPYHYQPPPDPFSSPNVQRATGRRQRPDPKAEADRISEISAFWRFVQVFGLIVVVTSFGGGLTANT